MTTPQDLYPNIPPTVLRNRNEVFRKPKNIPFWHKIANLVFFRMLENRFSSLMIKGKENILRGEDKKFATIYYAPHSNWWDGILGYNIATRVVKTKRFRIMVEEMNRFPLFQFIGAYPINKRTSQTAMEALKYTAEHILSDKEVDMWLFPQGIVRPPHFRPEIFQTGLSYMALEAVKNFGGVILQPVATYFCFLREDKPEILVEFDKPKIITEANFTRKELTALLQADFEKFCDRQLKNVACANFDGYEYVFKEKLRWWKKIEKDLKNIGMKNAKARLEAQKSIDKTKEIQRLKRQVKSELKLAKIAEKRLKHKD